jgi:hypothetical protein
MFTKNIFNQKDGIADLVGNILEADYKNKVEELKGDQHKIDKNKNGKIDSHDFKILRGEKPMQKEAAELEEGSTSKEKQKTPYRDIKSPEYKAAADKQKEKMKQDAATDSGKKLLNKIMSKSKNEEVEKKKENPFDALMKAAKERQGPQPSGGSGMKKGTRYGGSRQKDVKEEVELDEGSKHAARPRSASRPGTEPPVKGKLQDRMAAARERMDAKKKDVKEDVEQIDELNKDTVYSYNKKSISATGKLDKQLGSQIRSGNAPEANKTAHKLNKRLAGQDRADARLNKEEAEHNYTVKRTHSVKEPGELDSSTKRHHYDIHKDGKKVGELEHGEYFGDVSGKLHGKDLPPLGSYRGSHPESKLHSFLNSKTGTKWASNLHKYQKEEAEQVDERTLTKGETAEKERIVKGMKKSLAGFKSRYGDKAKSVMYATATKAAKKD